MTREELYGTENGPWVEGWSKPQGAGGSHYYIGEQVKLCYERSPAHWFKHGHHHVAPVIPDGESVLDPCLQCTQILAKLGSRPEPDPEPITRGFTVTPSRGQTRIELECRHQHGLIYVTEGAEANFVCSSRRRPAHSLAGFFRELGELQDNRVKNLMQRWGLYFRSLPLEVEQDDDAEANPDNGVPVGAAAGQHGDVHGPEGESAP